MQDRDGTVLYEGVGAGILNLDLANSSVRGGVIKDLCFAGRELALTSFDDLYILNCDFSDADLRQASFQDVRISGSQFRRSKLYGLPFIRVPMSRCDFEGADLTERFFMDCVLDEVNFKNATLASGFWKVTFQRSTLECANFTGAHFVEDCAFRFIDDLHTATGLLEITHHRSTTLDRHTLQHSIEYVPDAFLLGCGYTQFEIDNLRAIYVGSPIQFYSCFISHGEPDLAFANRLLADLRMSNISCWHYKDGMRGGEDYLPQINRAIRMHDKLLLVCSRSSAYRQGVLHEIMEALRAERETGSQKLFPIRLDDHILSDDFMDEAREKTRSGEWSENWVYSVRKKHIPDFSNWQNDNSKYQTEFQRLVEALSAGATRGARS